MHREKYYNSKLPLWVAVLFVVNILLVIGFEVLFIYKYPAELNRHTVGAYNSAWEGSTVQSWDDRNGLHACLAKTPEGDTLLLVSRGHPVFFGRGKLIHEQSIDPSVTQEQTFFVKNGVHTSEIAVTQGNTVSFRYAQGRGREVVTLYMLLAAVLEGLELLICWFIKKNL